jgi:hypothetical protein
MLVKSLEKQVIVENLVFSYREIGVSDEKSWRWDHIGHPAHHAVCASLNICAHRHGKGF